MDENLATARVLSDFNGAVTGYGFDKETHMRYLGPNQEL